jgi:hypothetical protein
MTKRAVVLVAAVLLMAAGTAGAGALVPATPVDISWDQYVTHQSLSVPHAYIEYRLVQLLPDGTVVVCAQQEVDTYVDGFNAPGSGGIPVPTPGPWDLGTVPCTGLMEEQTRLVWRIAGESPIYGVPEPGQTDRGDGWIAEQTITAGSPPPTALLLESFTARRYGDVARVEWQTATEVQTLGFNLYRGDTRLNQDLIPSPAPGSSVGATYTFVDNNPGQVYWIEQVDVLGNTARYGPATLLYLSYAPLVFR